MKTSSKSISLQKSLIALSLIAISGISFAGDKVNKTIAANADGVVEIHNIRGDIKIIGWDKNEVKLTGELDDLKKELIFKAQGNVVIINVIMPRRNINSGDGSDLTIYVPKTNRVDVSVVSTDLIIGNIQGGIDARTVSGEANISEVQKKLYMETVSGDITVKKSSGKMKLNSVSGDIRGDFDSKDVRAESVSGDVSLTLSNFDNLKAGSVSGELKVSGQLNDSGNLRLSTVNGDISLSFKDAVNARTKINAGPGGDINNRMSSDEVREIFPNQQKLNMTLGNGSGKIQIGTINGSIYLKGNNK
jgi:DUF4097 and DUF4098 domain-containing protein YvlB